MESPHYPRMESWLAICCPR